MEVTCSGVPGIQIICDGTEGLRRLDRLMARLKHGTTQRIDLLAELPAEADGVASCVMERVLTEREPTRSVFISRKPGEAAHVRWRNSPRGWSECREALGILISAADPRLIQTFGLLRDDVAVVEVQQA